MDQHPITIRVATPTYEEGLMFAHFLDQAAEGFFRLMLGRRVADIIATAYTKPDHDFSYRHVTFAECDNVIVGMVSGYTAEQHRRSSDLPLRQATGSRVLRMAAVAMLSAPLLRFLDTVADDDFYLQAVAVDKERRGMTFESHSPRLTFFPRLKVIRMSKLL